MPPGRGAGSTHSGPGWLALIAPAPREFQLRVLLEGEARGLQKFVRHFVKDGPDPNAVAHLAVTDQQLRVWYGTNDEATARFASGHLSARCSTTDRTSRPVALRASVESAPVRQNAFVPDPPDSPHPRTRPSRARHPQRRDRRSAARGVAFACASRRRQQERPPGDSSAAERQPAALAQSAAGFNPGSPR